MTTDQHILVINCGSSSLKYQLLNISEPGTPIAHGLVDRIGQSGATITHQADQKLHRERAIPDYEVALQEMMGAFTDTGVSLADLNLVAVAHRVVHGGERFVEPVVVTDEVEAAIAQLVPLAPLHNPANLDGIRVSRRLFSQLPQVAVFDTAFHSTIPEHARLYAVPQPWRRDFGVRRYGFHGTSHAYVSRAAAAALGRDPSECNVIVAHLGNGASISAVQGGQCIDTSMGMTPLEGLIMGTRSGDIDPALIFYLHRETGASFEELDQALNKSSGMLALTGASDMRVVEKMAASGDGDAATALEAYAYRIRKYIGAYMAVLGRVDAMVFTAGVGENSPDTRQRVVTGLEPHGIKLDESKNEARGEIIVSTADSSVAVMVIATNEESEIAQQAWSVVQSIC